jgi:protein-L-isoaspartate O-methyltransferase
MYRPDRLVDPPVTAVTVDIDANIIANTRAGLDRAGYPQVQAACGDGEYALMSAISVIHQSGLVTPRSTPIAA